MINSLAKNQERLELEYVLATPEQYRAKIDETASWARYGESSFTAAKRMVAEWYKAEKQPTLLEALTTWVKTHPNATVQLGGNEYNETTVVINASRGDMDDFDHQPFARRNDALTRDRLMQNNHYMPPRSYDFGGQ